MENCRNCAAQLTGNFCSNCGHPRKLARIDREYLFREIGSVLNFDKGILFSIKELVIRPGATVKIFFKEDRNRLVKPIIFIIIGSLVYTFFREIFHFEDGYIYFEDDKQSTALNMFGWVSNNYGYGNMIMGVFIALWIKLLFRKYHYNFYEILILLCFVMGMGMLMLAVFGLIQGLTGLEILDVGGMVFVIYSTWAIAQFFDKSKFMSYFKALYAYVLGVFTFSLAILLVGHLIDTFILG